MWKALVLLLFLVSVSLCEQREPINLPVTHKPIKLSSAASRLNAFKRIRAGPNDLPLAGNDQIVSVGIQVGSQAYTVLLDTGSSFLALPAAGCINCAKNAPNYAHPVTSTALSCPTNTCPSSSCCNGNLCPTTDCFFDISYADQSALQGTVVTDTVTFGGLTTTATFGAIYNESANFVPAGSADGILGFAQNAADVTCFKACVTPLLDTYVNAGLVADEFALYLDTVGGGKLTLGGYDPAIASNFLYTPIIGNDFYYVTMTGLLLNGTSIATSGFGGTILDSGTTQLLLPNAIFNNLIAQWQTPAYCDSLPMACGNNSVLTTDYCLGTLSQVQQYPNITVQLSGLSVQVPPTAYFLPVSDHDETIYCFYIAGWSNSQTILGYAFLRSQYVHFNRTAVQVGIAGASVAPTVAPTPSTATGAVTAATVAGTVAHAAATDALSAAASLGHSSSAPAAVAPSFVAVLCMVVVTAMVVCGML